MARMIGTRSGRGGVFYCAYVALASATSVVATRTTTAVGVCKNEAGDAGKNELTALVIEALVRGSKGVRWREPFTNTEAVVVMHTSGLHFDTPRVRSRTSYSRQHCPSSPPKACFTFPPPPPHLMYHENSRGSVAK